jgi:putative ABC transport system permease protein
MQSSRADLVPSLKAEGIGTGLSRLRLRSAFVVGQVAMSILLVIGAGLFLRALQHASAIAPGFDERNVDVVSVQLALAGYKDRAADEFVRRLLDRTRALPDIDAASAALDLPLDGDVYGLGNLKKPGAPQNLEADWNVVEPGYFRALTLPLVRGRDFTDADGPTSARVAIVNEALARAAWPGEDPIGRELDAESFGAQNRLTVVGVTTDARVITLGGEVRPYIYVPMAQQSVTNVSLVVKHRGTASSVPQVRALLHELSPNLPITVALPLSEITAIGLVPQRIASAVAGSLGVVGLLLAAIGIYGVTSYAVSRRTREIGIRIALGADRSSVLTLMLRHGLTLALAGVALGTLAAAFASRLIESLLFGIRALDPLTFVSAAGLFTVVTLVASYLPARRAARVDPMVALRNE